MAEWTRINTVIFRHGFTRINTVEKQIEIRE
jgi:hypothetical protein